MAGKSWIIRKVDEPAVKIVTIVATRIELSVFWQDAERGSFTSDSRMLVFQLLHPG